MFGCDNEGDERAAAWHAARPDADGGGGNGRQLLILFSLSAELNSFVGEEKKTGVARRQAAVMRR